jgi:H+-transporting ATPase
MEYPQMNAQPDSKSLSLEELKKKLGSSRNGLSQAEAHERLAQYGPNEIEGKRTNPLLKFLSYFWGPIPWMIEVAAILSAVVRNWPDLVIILVLLLFNAVVGFWQEFQAGNAIEQLKKKLALKARVLRDGKWQEVEARALVPGDIARLRLGDVIPADMSLLEGDYLSVDQSALTGESLPVEKRVGDVAYSGSVAKQGEMIALVTATAMSTYFGKTAKLVGEAHAVSHFQKAVLRIGDYLIYMALALVAVLLLVGFERHWPALELVQFALILAVASIPVAMPAVLSVTMAVGALALSHLKAIVSRLESIEEMAGLDVLCSDKTGTLTQNKLTLGDPVLFGTADAQALILAGGLASKAEDHDAVDLAVLAGLSDARALEGYKQEKFVPFDPVSKRTEASVRDANGARFAVTKGAPQVILGLGEVKGADLERAQRAIDELAGKGYRTLGVARRDEGKSWRFLGLLPLFDPPREDAAETIREAEAHGVDVKMVTGDNLAIAREISAKLGLGTNIAVADALVEGDQEAAGGGQIERADGFAQVFPEHKYAIVKALQARGHLVGMTGDGVNDAPALKQADVGIAVSGATDAARAAAALVLTAPGLGVIVKAIEEARRIFERMNSYAIYRITETIRIMIFMVLTILVYDFYPITAIMIILLALLNDLPIMTIAKDNTWLDPKPVRWQMPRVLTVATVLGAVGVFETFGLLIIAHSWLHISLAQLQSVIFLKLAVAGHMTLFVARSRRPFWKSPYPAPVLLGAVLGTQMVAVLIVAMGWFVPAIPWLYIAGVWAYCIAWIFVEDAAKLMVYRHLAHTDKYHDRFLQTVGGSLHTRHAQGDVAQRIAKRAYELYEQRGRQDGHAVEDWVEAEREIRREESSN